MCRNSWIPVSSRHVTYEDSQTFTEYQIETFQEAREGSPDSQLEGCYVRPVRCKTCKVPIGVRCNEAPEAKVQLRYVGNLCSKSLRFGMRASAYLKDR